MATRKLICALALVLSAGAFSTAGAQTLSYNARTGDVWVDNRLGEINDYGQQYRDPFIGEMTRHYGAPRELVVELLDQRSWKPGDVYYACAIASAMNVPCANVVREYDRDPGQGWGNVAKRMGIKPGSPQFHALKRGTVNTYDRWGHPIALDSNARVDWSQHAQGKGHEKSHNKAHDKAHAKSHDKAHDKAHAKAQAKAQGKAHAKAHAKAGSGNGGGKGNSGNAGKGDNAKGKGKP